MYNSKIHSCKVFNWDAYNYKTEPCKNYSCYNLQLLNFLQ